jgi:hypothetical protein
MNRSRSKDDAVRRSIVTLEHEKVFAVLAEAARLLRYEDSRHWLGVTCY